MTALGLVWAVNTKKSRRARYPGVISTLTNDGQQVMGPGVLVWHHPDNSIVSNSLLTVESNHFCVLKSGGAILNV
jgi:hypothetical protein